MRSGGMGRARHAGYRSKNSASFLTHTKNRGTLFPMSSLRARLSNSKSGMRPRPTNLQMMSRRGFEHVVSSMDTASFGTVFKNSFRYALMLFDIAMLNSF